MNRESISPVPREARPFQGRTAGIISRFAAAVLDAAVVAAFLLAIYACYATIRFVVDPLHFRLPPLSAILSLTTALAVLVLYLAATWSTTGRTYGCHIMGLRVVTPRRDRLRPLHALARAVSCALLPLGLLWCAVSRNNLSVQDILLKTVVVYDWQAGLPAEGTRAAAAPCPGQEVSCERSDASSPVDSGASSPVDEERPSPADLSSRGSPQRPREHPWSDAPSDAPVTGNRPGRPARRSDTRRSQLSKGSTADGREKR